MEEELFDYAMDMATFGVKPKGHYPPVRTRQQAYASADDDHTTTASELWGDLVSGRLFLISSNSEHATGNLMESKLTFVTHPDVTNPGCTKTRYISDPAWQSMKGCLVKIARPASPPGINTWPGDL